MVLGWLGCTLNILCCLVKHRCIIKGENNKAEFIMEFANGMEYIFS